MGKAMNSNALTHKSHDHNDRKVCSLNAKSIFQWTSPRQFRTQF